MGRFFDFDAAWEEQAAKTGAPEPIRVRVFGQEWDLHATTPAAVILYGARMMDAGQRALTDAETISFATALIPEQVLDQWLARGIDIPRLQHIIATVLPEYMAAAAKGDPGEAGAQREGNGSSRPSSAAGRRSKRTGPASTGRT